MSGLLGRLELMNDGKILLNISSREIEEIVTLNAGRKGNMQVFACLPDT